MCGKTETRPGRKNLYRAASDVPTRATCHAASALQKEAPGKLQERELAHEISQTFEDIRGGARGDELLRCLLDCVRGTRAHDGIRYRAASAEDGLQDAASGHGIEGKAGEEHRRAQDEQVTNGLKVVGRVAPARVQEVELDGEEDGEDRLQQARGEAGVVHVLELDAVLERDLGGRVEALDDNIRGEAAQALHGGGAQQAPVRVLLEGSFDVLPVTGL
mmetsp:Transcript_45179/g.141560  ORF Transcript_45179/g.141560 Transcript_45179/m.141560 type:complete len:218 (+) Transcript_45179:1356-2009(+)